MPKSIATNRTYKKLCYSQEPFLTKEDGRLAYVEGYYDVSRKISPEELAKLLKVEKGTVGEHLRRAEKNIIDFLMTA